MIPLLKGLRILDLTSVILGPYGTQILGDLGAEVIKIEPPEGDSMRPVAPVAAPGISAIFSNFNRNKRSVALDLKTDAGKAALRKLLPTVTSHACWARVAEISALWKYHWSANNGSAGTACGQRR